MFPLAIIVLLLVFFLIATRHLGNFRLQIWQVMLAGAIVVLVLGQISPIDAISSVNLDILVLLFGMFIIGRALDESGYLSHISHRLFSSARNVDHLVLIILFGGAFASAVLMKDSLVVIATPALLLHSKVRRIPYKPLLLALAFGVTIGSVMSPFGNPQNMLIAIKGGVPNPVVTFPTYLLIPTLLCLVVAYLVLRFFYSKSFKLTESDASEETIKDPHLAELSKISLLLLLALSFLAVILFIVYPSSNLDISYIPLVASLPVLILSEKRLEIIKTIDWKTLIFFIAMFILMQSVWETGFFQSVIDGSQHTLVSIDAVLAISVVASQFISNIPLVALYLPILSSAGVSIKVLMALAAGSTIAGNVSIIAAASNILIVESTEEEGKKLGFWEFAKVGIPLTIICIFIYWFFLAVI